MNNNLSVIILAAGMGTRMKSSISKPLHKVGNLEMINHVINMAEKLDSNDIIVVASRENEEHIRKSVKDNIKVGKITIGTYLPLEGIKFPADLLDDKNYNGIVSTSNSNFQFVPLLTFDMEKASNYSSGLKPGDYYTFASNILYADEMKASFSLSESPESKTGVLFGSCFLCPFNNGSHHSKFADNGYATLNII